MTSPRTLRVYALGKMIFASGPRRASIFAALADAQYDVDSDAVGAIHVEVMNRRR